jgi:uncharacterized membrane protein
LDALLAKLQSDSPAIAMIITIVALGLLEWGLGILDALRSGQFAWKYLDVWVRVQLLGRILPVVLVLAFSQVFGTVDIAGIKINLLWVGGQGAALAYAAATIASIVNSLNPSVKDVPPTE